MSKYGGPLPHRPPLPPVRQHCWFLQGKAERLPILIPKPRFRHHLHSNRLLWIFRIYIFSRFIHDDTNISSILFILPQTNFCNIICISMFLPWYAGQIWNKRKYLLYIKANESRFKKGSAQLFYALFVPYSFWVAHRTFPALEDCKDEKL